MAFAISLVIAFTRGLFTGFHQPKTNPDCGIFIQTKAHVSYVD